MVEAVGDASHCIEALEAYKGMCDSGPPGNTNSSYGEMNSYVTNGQAVFAMAYFPFFPDLSNQGTGPNYCREVGYFSNSKGLHGQQYATLGGQGASMNDYISSYRDLDSAGAGLTPLSGSATIGAGQGRII